MNTNYNVVYIFAGLVVLALFGAEASERNPNLYRLLRPSYLSAPVDKTDSDIDLDFNGPPEVDWENSMPLFSFGSFIRRPPPGFRVDLMEDKRFGYMGSRGKRMDHNTAFMTLRDLLDLYSEKARQMPFRSSNARPINQDSALLNNKRQPHFGFHGVRG